MWDPSEGRLMMLYRLLIIVFFSSLCCTPAVSRVIHKRAAFYIANETMCIVDGEVYRNGDPVPTDDECERCTCRPPGFSCVLRDCDTKPGCKAVRKIGECCPEYVCGCVHNNRLYEDGELIRDLQNNCYTCRCHGSSISCTFADCLFRGDCPPEYIPGECCPRYDHCPPMSTTTTTTPTTPPIVQQEIEFINLTTQHLERFTSEDTTVTIQDITSRDSVFTTASYDISKDKLFTVKFTLSSQKFSSIHDYDIVELTTLLPLQPVTYKETTKHVVAPSDGLTTFKDALIIDGSDKSTTEEFSQSAITAEFTTPITETESTTPTTETESTTPITETESTTPITEIKSSTSITEIESTTPITETKSTTPITETKFTTPITETKSITPMTETESTTSITEIESSDSETYVSTLGDLESTRQDSSASSLEISSIKDESLVTLESVKSTEDLTVSQNETSDVYKPDEGKITSFQEVESSTLSSISEASTVKSDEYTESQQPVFITRVSSDERNETNTYQQNTDLTTDSYVPSNTDTDLLKASDSVTITHKDSTTSTNYSEYTTSSEISTEEKIEDEEKLPDEVHFVTATSHEISSESTASLSSVSMHEDLDTSPYNIHTIETNVSPEGSEDTKFDPDDLHSEEAEEELSSANQTELVDLATKEDSDISSTSKHSTESDANMSTINDTFETTFDEIPSLVDNDQIIASYDQQNETTDLKSNIEDNSTTYISALTSEDTTADTKVSDFSESHTASTSYGETAESITTSVSSLGEFKTSTEFSESPEITETHQSSGISSHYDESSTTTEESSVSFTDLKQFSSDSESSQSTEETHISDSDVGVTSDHTTSIESVDELNSEGELESEHHTKSHSSSSDIPTTSLHPEQSTVSISETGTFESSSVTTSKDDDIFLFQQTQTPFHETSSTDNTETFEITDSTSSFVFNTEPSLIEDVNKSASSDIHIDELEPAEKTTSVISGVSEDISLASYDAERELINETEIHIKETFNGIVDSSISSNRPDVTEQFPSLNSEDEAEESIVALTRVTTDSGDAINTVTQKIPTESSLEKSSKEQLFENETLISTVSEINVYSDSSLEESEASTTTEEKTDLDEIDIKDRNETLDSDVNYILQTDNDIMHFSVKPSTGDAAYALVVTSERGDEETTETSVFTAHSETSSENVTDLASSTQYTLTVTSEDLITLDTLIDETSTTASEEFSTGNLITNTEEIIDMVTLSSDTSKTSTKDKIDTSDEEMAITSEATSSSILEGDSHSDSQSQVVEWATEEHSSIVDIKSHTTTAYISQPSTYESTYDSLKEADLHVKQDKQNISTHKDVSSTSTASVQVSTVKPLVENVPTTPENGLPSEIPAFEPPLANIMKQPTILIKPHIDKGKNSTLVMSDTITEAKSNFTSDIAKEDVLSKLSLTLTEDDENASKNSSSVNTTEDYDNNIFVLHHEYTIPESEIDNNIEMFDAEEDEHPPGETEENSHTENENTLLTFTTDTALIVNASDQEMLTAELSTKDNITELIYNSIDAAKIFLPSVVELSSENLQNENFENKVNNITLDILPDSNLFPIPVKNQDKNSSFLIGPQNIGHNLSINNSIANYTEDILPINDERISTESEKDVENLNTINQPENSEEESISTTVTYIDGKFNSEDNSKSTESLENIIITETENSNIQQYESITLGEKDNPVVENTGVDKIEAASDVLNQTVNVFSTVETNINESDNTAETIANVATSTENSKDTFKTTLVEELSSESGDVNFVEHDTESHDTDHLHESHDTEHSHESHDTEHFHESHEIEHLNETHYIEHETDVDYAYQDAENADSSNEEIKSTTTSAYNNDLHPDLITVLQEISSTLNSDLQTSEASNENESINDSYDYETTMSSDKSIENTSTVKINVLFGQDFPDIKHDHDIAKDFTISKNSNNSNVDYSNFDTTEELESSESKLADTDTSDDIVTSHQTEHYHNQDSIEGNSEKSILSSTISEDETGEYQDADIDHSDPSHIYDLDRSINSEANHVSFSESTEELTTSSFSGEVSSEHISENISISNTNTPDDLINVESESSSHFTILEYLGDLFTGFTTYSSEVTESTTPKRDSISTNESDLDKSKNISHIYVESITHNSTVPSNNSYSSNLKEQFSEYGYLGGVYITGQSKYNGSSSKEQNQQTNMNTVINNPSESNITLNVTHSDGNPERLDNPSNSDTEYYEVVMDSENDSTLETKQSENTINPTVAVSTIKYQDDFKHENQNPDNIHEEKIFLNSEAISLPNSSQEANYVENLTVDTIKPYDTITQKYFKTTVENSEYDSNDTFSESSLVTSEKAIQNASDDLDLPLNKNSSYSLINEDGPEKGGEWFEPTEPNLPLVNAENVQTTSNIISLSDDVETQSSVTTEISEEHGLDEGGDPFEPTFPEIFSIDDVNLETKTEQNSNDSISTVPDAHDGERSTAVTLNNINENFSTIESSTPETYTTSDESDSTFISGQVPPLPILLKNMNKPKSPMNSAESASNSKTENGVNNLNDSNDINGLNQDDQTENSSFPLIVQTGRRLDHPLLISDVISHVFKAPGYDSEVQSRSWHRSSSRRKDHILRLKRGTKYDPLEKQPLAVDIKDMNTFSSTMSDSKNTAREQVHLVNNKNTLLVEGYGQKPDGYFPVTSSVIIVQSDKDTEENEAKKYAKRKPAAVEPEDNVSEIASRITEGSSRSDSKKNHPNK